MATGHAGSVMPPDGPSRFESEFVGLFVRAQRCARRILGDREAAEDVAAETMARAFAHWSTISSYAPAWVTRVSINVATDLLRRKPALFAGRVVLDDGLVDRLVLREHVARLPRRQRDVILARYVLGFDEKDTAALFGISVGTVHTHVKRGLARLRTELTDTRDGAAEP